MITNEFSRILQTTLLNVTNATIKTANLTHLEPSYLLDHPGEFAGIVILTFVLVNVSILLTTYFHRTKMSYVPPDFSKMNSTGFKLCQVFKETI